MAETRDLLVEIGTEELPPTSLKRLSEAFAMGFHNQLAQHRLDFSAISPFATPRRLALVIEDLQTRQKDREVVRRGPALSAAFDAQGGATKAAMGFARSCNVKIDDLEREETSKGAWLIFRQIEQGQDAIDLILKMTAKALETLPIRKRMRWGDQEEQFVRPVHWAAIVFGEEPVLGQLFGIQCGSSTKGHRFHHPGPISIPSSSDYAELLREQGNVEPIFDRRREMIRSQVHRLAREAGGEPVFDEDLLDEVTALCEWPYAIRGSFEERFLEVPSEVLIETMQQHQKYFPVVAESGKLLPCFITISNICSLDPEQVRAGNERVIRPRFSDAAFFWHQDLRQPLQRFESRLEKVVFQEQLGTLAEKAARVSQLSGFIANVLGMDENLAVRSAHLAKCDLLTQMVVEFPSLQGTMGRYYAEAAGEDPCVVSAMEQQYLPRHAGDRLPDSDCGLVLSIADKLDTLVGIFAIGARPTGDKDPYALRRATIGLLRILIETPLPLDLKNLLAVSANGLRDKVDATDATSEVFAYSMERLKGYYQDKGVRGDIVDSVLATTPRIPSDIDRRIRALEKFLESPEASSLTAANKRIRNILQRSEIDAFDEDEVDWSILQHEEEKRLLEQLSSLQSTVIPRLSAYDYEGVLKLLSYLKGDIDAFFSGVMVMHERPEIRRNRLALLRAVESLFMKVADLSVLK